MNSSAREATAAEARAQPSADQASRSARAAATRASINPSNGGCMRIRYGAMDRMSPRQRPAGHNDGTQNWRQLLFLHWTVPAEVLRPLVPPSLELDLWEGEAWVGV